ncbi:ATP-binding protein [Pseudonocardia sp. RS010]|uniref:ATP-binding protein n=1 Tax=Pseudonocardia sp. RS010 TaxID=3385979 RepID=UPI0039A3A990
MDQRAVRDAPGRETDGMVHEGVPYREPALLARELHGPVDDALRGGGQVVAVLDDPNRAALETVLGSAASAVDWRDPVEVHRVPAFTVASRWARLARRNPRPEARTTVIAQHLDLPGLDRAHWIRLDAALTVALDGLPVTMLCPCPADGDLELVRATHPSLRVDGESRPTGGPRNPVQVVAEYPPPPPPDLGPPTAELTVTLAALPAVRHLVAETAPTAGLDPERTADLVLAVNEIATNSLEHGPGSARLRLWARDGLVAEVYDVGRMAVPFPGMVAPPTSGVRGRGLWLASELTDVLQVWSDDSGTTVRLLAEPTGAG